MSGHDDPSVAVPSWFAGGGEMGDLMRSVDWSSTPVGAPETWPPALRTMLSILLTSEHAMFIYWGSELVQFYNDAYRPILGSKKHPAAMGQLGRECWKEVWDVLEPMMDKVWGGGATHVNDGLLVLDRHGFLEECYFDYAYTPIRDETGNVAGIFVPCGETTGRILADRRLKTLGALSAKTSGAKTPEDVCRLAARVLADARSDVPFSLLYLVDDDNMAARLVSAIGIDSSHPAAPAVVHLQGPSEAVWPLDKACDGEIDVALSSRQETATLCGGPWPEPPSVALVLPLPREADAPPCGYLVVGISPRLMFDEAYRSFLRLGAGHVAAAVQNARASAAERKRADALAELDRAKTAFFSNVSHEFRTPLTLILGHTEEALTTGEKTLSGEQLGAVNRNALRLLKLVNALLDFSRVEAGRAEASYEPTDLAALTINLTSAFRSAIERAGLAFEVDCTSLVEPVYVDREMWEKIVLNLLSNALKFTFEGAIRISLRGLREDVELIVEDTGTGIPEDELPDLFQRFHRVQRARARTHEGSGIGLALVHELVKLHGGNVRVVSKIDAGTTFTISIPLRAVPPSEERDRDANGSSAHGATAATPYVEEALRWLSGPAMSSKETAASAPSERDATDKPRARILVADDNADLRDYVAGLLTSEFEVQTVSDGLAALEAARAHKPDLVVSDVMMPRLDGFGLLRDLRADPGTRDVPFILLSARAGEESTVEGIESGADDYLVKPFSARELRARVRTHLQMARVRAEVARHQANEQRLQGEVEARDEFLSVASHELRTPLSVLTFQIEGLVRNMLRGAPEPGGPERVLKGAEVVQRQAARLARIVDTMLDVSRLTTGRLDLELEELDLAALAREIVEGLRGELERTKTSLVLRADTAVVGRWDRLRLEQIAYNLLTNAIKFGQGKPVEMEVHGDDRSARLVVRDHGIGIPADAKSRIFGRFERAVSDRNYGGMGLGLWIAQQSAEAMHGCLTVDSQIGAGSTFTLELSRHP